MSIENETADQVVKMVLQGSDVVLKLSGEATLKIAKNKRGIAIERFPFLICR